MQAATQMLQDAKETITGLADTAVLPSKQIDLLWGRSPLSLHLHKGKCPGFNKNAFSQQKLQLCFPFGVSLNLSHALGKSNPCKVNFIN